MEETPSPFAAASVPLTSRPALLTSLVLVPFAVGALLAVIVMVAVVPVPLEWWVALLLVLALVMVGISVSTLARSRRIAAAAEGLWVSPPWKGGEVLVPWERMARIEVLLGGTRGWMCFVEYQAHPGKAGTRRIATPYGRGDADHPATPPRLEQVRALWQAAAGPVAIEAHGWGWRVERRPG